MPRYVAFLRAINVGGHTVKMDHLRELFESLGFNNVATFIASGNVIFETRSTKVPALEQKIAAHLRGALGYDVATFLRTTPELAAVADYTPFPTIDHVAEGFALNVGFLHATPSAEAQKALSAFTTDVDEFHVHDREVYWLCRTKISDSTFNGGKLEKALGMPSTMRNVNTVAKLAAKYPAV